MSDNICITNVVNGVLTPCVMHLANEMLAISFSIQEKKEICRIMTEMFKGAVDGATSYDWYWREPLNNYYPSRKKIIKFLENLGYTVTPASGDISDGYDSFCISWC